MIVRPGRLDRNPGGVTWKEGLAYHRVADQVDQVGGAAPQLTRGCRARLLPQMAPCLLARAAMALRVRRFQFGSERLADRVVHGKPIASCGHERQYCQLLIHFVGIALPERPRAVSRG